VVSHHEKIFLLIPRSLLRGGFIASLRAVTLAKLDARQQHGEAASAFSMASLKRRAFNQHLLERIVQHLARGHSLEKSSPDYEELCNYGIITETAA
jgi:hypothetical protein